MLSRTVVKMVAWALCLGSVGAGEAGADMRWTSSLAVNQMYDDNVNYASAQKQEDFTTTVTPNMAFTGRAWDLDLTGNIGSTWTEYARRASSSVVTSSGGVTLKADALTGRLLRTWGLSVSENYSYTRDLPTFAQFGNQAALSNSGVQTSRFTTLANNLGISTSYGLTPQAQLTGGYTNTLTRFDSNGALTNSTSHALQGGWRQTLTPAVSVHVGYTANRFVFDGGGSSDTHGGDAGVSWQVRPDLTVDGSMGGSYLPSQDRINPNFSAGFTKQFQASNVGARAARSISAGGGLAAAVSTQDTLSAQASRQVTPSLSVTLSANRAATKSVGAKTVDVTTLGVTPGLSYTITRWLSMNATYSYLKQQSAGVAGSALVRNTMTVGFTCTWP